MPRCLFALALKKNMAQGGRGPRGDGGQGGPSEKVVHGRRARRPQQLRMRFAVSILYTWSVRVRVDEQQSNWVVPVEPVEKPV
jgi:hypothetical protein